VSFVGGRVGGHYYCRVGGVGGGGKVGVVHEGDVGLEGGAGCEVELGVGVRIAAYWLFGEKGTYKSGVV
jgi:hypothetical protein